MPLDARAWLESQGFGAYADLFQANQVDGDALPLLTEAHLQELGVPLGVRVKLIAAIAKLGQGGAPSAERRRLTVMFVDLVGSTALSTRMDPEELRQLIREYQAAVTHAAARYDAHVARYLGDGALLYFGYPRAHEDDAERAVRAALAISRSVAAVPGPGGEPLAVHVGIATGLVVVGDVLGAGAAVERAVVGETPNVAARLQQLAGPGQIYVSAQTRALTGNHFEWRDLGAQAVKGVGRPVLAYELLAERAVESRFDARRDALLLAMVGRSNELGHLLRAWDEAVAGRGKLVLVSGEAGIGKSRLIRALEQSIRDEPHLRVANQCSPYHAGSALHPVIQQLARAAGVRVGMANEVRLARLEAMLKGATPGDAALIAALLGIDATKRFGAIDLTPEQQRARTFEALISQTILASRREPVLWILEDAHWADPTTLELLSLALERIATGRVLAIVTARPDFVSPLDAPHASRILLERLGRDDIADMVKALARGKVIPAPMVAEIAARADGVPLFVEEITKSVLEGGVLQERDGAYVLDGSPWRDSVPASLHDSMMARLDRHVSLKEVAQTASCIGREFNLELLQAIAAMTPQALRDGLARLEEAELVFRRGTTEPLYSFKHALMRDAAYESLLKSRRQEIHARIVAALEASPDARAEVLAQHAEMAGLVERAVEAWQLAAQAAIARPAYEEAISHVRQALRLAEAAPDAPEWRQRRLQLLLLLGQALIPARGYSHSETVAAFEQAQRLAGAIGDSPLAFSVAAGMWVAYYVRGEHAVAYAIASEMLSSARRDGNVGRMLTGLRAVGIEQMILGELLAARDTFAEARAMADEIQHRSRERRMAVAHRFAADPEIATQFHVALTHWALGDLDRGRELCAGALVAARAMGHPHTLGHALTHAAIFAAAMRDAVGLDRLAAETLAFAEAHDMTLWRGYGAILQGCAGVLAGEFARALPSMERGLKILARSETNTMVPAHRAVHAYALAAMGRMEEAREEHARVEQELATGTQRYWWPEALRWSGDYLVLAEGAGSAAAEGAYVRAMEVAVQQNAKAFELGAATSLAAVWAGRGDGGRAMDLLAPRLEAFQEGLDTPLLLSAAGLYTALRAGEARSASRVVPDPA